MESRRISIPQFQEGTVCRSQLDTVAAHELGAGTPLLRSDWIYIQTYGVFAMIRRLNDP